MGHCLSYHPPYDFPQIELVMATMEQYHYHPVDSRSLSQSVIQSISLLGVLSTSQLALNTW